MRKNIKIVIGAILALVILMMAMPVFAVTNEKLIIVEKSEKEYMIYIDEISNNQFQFAFSLVSDEVETNLNYKNATMDTENEGTYVAYIDEAANDTYFPTGEGYLYVKDMEDNVLMSGEKVDLSKMLSRFELAMIDMTGDMIPTDKTGSFSESNNDKGYDSTTTAGTVKIKYPDGGATYYYDLVKVASETDDYGTLFGLAEDLGKGEGSAVDILNNSKAYSDLYYKLLEERDWKVMEDYTVVEPLDARNGDKYVLFLREEFDETGETYLDVNYLISTYDYDNEVIGEQTLEEVVKLPVTYDNITLLVIFGILFVLIVIAVIAKVLVNRKGKSNS